MTSPRILIVDDEADACRNLADILAELDYQVEMAFHAETALKSIQEKEHDLVLLDLKMPQMDGLSLFRQMQQVQSGMVAILVTAYTTEAQNKDVLASGIWKVLSKPVDVPRLLELIDHHFSR